LVFDESQCYYRKKINTFLLYHLSSLLYKVALNRKNALIHLACWLIFCIYEILLAGSISGEFLPFIHYLLFYSINIALFYFHAYFLLNYTTTFKINLWRVPLVVILEFAVYVLANLTISFLVNKYLYNIADGTIINYKYLPGAAHRGVYFILYSTLYYLIIIYIRKRENELQKRIEIEKLNNQVLVAEQAFLRAKINPHLLFNTLSFIKYAAKKKPIGVADEAIIRLSGIMNFALENNSDTQLLTHELEQVENIIALNQLRFDHTLNISLIKNIENKNVSLIPLVLLTIVENVFKHGNLMDAEHPAVIKVESTSAYLKIETSNLVNETPVSASHNIGIENIQSRLEQFYKDRYEFDLRKEDNIFLVSLRIDLL